MPSWNVSCYELLVLLQITTPPHFFIECAQWGVNSETKAAKIMCCMNEWNMWGIPRIQITYILPENCIITPKAKYSKHPSFKAPGEQMGTL